MYFEGSGAEILVESLRVAGVEVLFGVPGDTGVALYDALGRQPCGPRHILARAERSAASMADAYARVAHRVGVVEASSGGGATFLVGGLGEPYAASVPLLVITSDIHRASRGSAAITEINQVELFSAVTKHQVVIENASEMATGVAEALRVATSGRPGPVSLIVPEDVFEEHAQVTLPAMSDALLPVRTVTNLEIVPTVAAWLAQASRPALVLGSGVHWSMAWSEIVVFAERFGLPVATTIHGKGAFPERHALSLGVAGANGARDYSNEYLATADVVLFMGTRANSTDTDGFRSPPRSTPRVIHVDIDPERAGKNYPGSLALVGDVGHTVSRLLEEPLPHKDDRTQAIKTWIAARRARYEEPPSAHPPRGLDPRRIVEMVQTYWGDNILVVGEPGTPTPYVSAYWTSPGFRRDVILPRGHGAMGFAIPAAVGLALAKPLDRVVAFTTDGSFAMACGELETVVRLQLPIIFLHLSNGSLGWIKALQHFYMDRRYFGVDFGSVDAVAVATAFGLKAYRVNTLEELRQVLDDAMMERVPIFIDIPIPDEFEHLPPVAPWHATLVGNAGRPAY